MLCKVKVSCIYTKSLENHKDSTIIYEKVADFSLVHMIYKFVCHESMTQILLLSLITIN